MFYSPLPCPLQTWLINCLFPTQSGCSFRILLTTVLQDTTSTGSELAVELRPICHSGSNRTKTKHQKQQTGTNPSSFQGSKKAPCLHCSYLSSQTDFHHSKRLEGTFIFFNYTSILSFFEFFNLFYCFLQQVFY